MAEADIDRDPDIARAAGNRGLLNYDGGQRLCIEHQAEQTGKFSDCGGGAGDTDT